MLNAALSIKEASLRQAWEQATPFRHLIIDDFFDPDICRELERDFPRFEDRNALNEFGEVGGKAVVEDLGSVSPIYARLHEYLRSKPFLLSVSALTGIEKLLPDPDHYGGGTHENREGQELDPHVDYNYINGGTLHRRINLIVYLNDEWEDSWGGSLELHSDPWEPERNRITTVTPLFNRAVLFETNEYSWHGFRKISLPADKKHLSRRSVAIYLYTRTRPEDEIAPSHGTFYVQRPLPDYIRPGFVLDESAVNELRGLLRRRDDWLRHYQRKELEYGYKRSLSPGKLQWWIDRAYRWMPLSAARKKKIGEWLFQHAGWLFRHSPSYQRWQDGQ